MRSRRKPTAEATLLFRSEGYVHELTIRGNDHGALAAAVARAVPAMAGPGVSVTHSSWPTPVAVPDPGGNALRGVAGPGGRRRRVPRRRIRDRGDVWRPTGTLHPRGARPPAPIVFDLGPITRVPFDEDRARSAAATE